MVDSLMKFTRLQDGGCEGVRFSSAVVSGLFVVRSGTRAAMTVSVCVAHLALNPFLSFCSARAIFSDVTKSFIL